MGVLKVSGGALAALLLLVAMVFSTPGRAQDGVWVQIEARPSEAAATERAQDYASRLPNVAGFRLGSGWYAIALGPFAPDAAQAELSRLRSAGLIPRDSYITDRATLSDQFWPDGAIVRQVTPVALPDAPEPEPTDETPAQARAAERLLSRDDREEIQRALQTLGFYQSGIDGAFGPGTRRAMADWQEAFGYEPTGILTTAQRGALLGELRAALESLGLELVTDPEAGIEIVLPVSEVSFSGYDAPFARYDGENATVLLISQTGDAATLRGLYDVMQTLEIVPLRGAREIERTSFTLTGWNDDITSYTYAALGEDGVKGYTLVWPSDDEKRRLLVLRQMRDSFRQISGIVLPDTAGDRSVQRPDLLSGLEIRQPETSVSGFFVDGRGVTLTAASALASCSRVTLGGESEADVTAIDTDLGLALLTPRTALAPLGVGRFSTEIPLLQSDIAVAGFSYGGRLGAPTISFGRLEDLRGLNGEETLTRLAMRVEPGDAGGPVMDAAGGVLGMLLPADRDTGRSLPADVHFAADAQALADFLAANGIDPAVLDETRDLAPEDLALVGADMTVLVECWN
ncbi:MAG: peptidoglycan-binding protein [Pseudomonadota bacterium]